MKLVREVTILTLLLAAGLLIQRLISFPSSLVIVISGLLTVAATPLVKLILP